MPSELLQPPLTGLPPSAVFEVPRPRALVAEPPRPTPLSLFRSHLGAALFGVAMALGGVRDVRTALFWALALPVLFSLNWLLCLPALYIPWAARESRLTVSSVGRSAARAVVTFGECLGASAPIQWFFAVTAPQSPWVASLGFMFVWLALVAANVTFSRGTHAQGLPLPAWAQVGFFALFAVTFFQFGHIAGLRFFAE